MTTPILMTSDDPNLPFEVEDQVVRRDTHGNDLTAVRSASNHFLVLDSQPLIYGEDNGRRLWRLAKIPEEAMTACVDLIKGLLESRNRSEILEINNQPATECKLAQVFLRNGFDQKGKTLVWIAG